jgi:hypothetical protein
VNALGHVLFNMLANSFGSFLLTLVIVYGALWLFRFGPCRCRLWLLSLPFAKLLLELAGGVPESSFLWAKLAGKTQDLGSFRAGFGVSQFGPKLTFALGAFSGGLIYPQSLGDVLDSGLTKHVARGLPGALAAAVVLIGLTRLAIRVTRSRAFLRDVLRGARVIDRRSVGRRSVAVLVSEQYVGVPFAAGMLRPRVVFSARTHAAFTDAERAAALQHELAHVAHHDLALLAGLGILEDLFWFLPGARGLVVRIRAVLEQRADDAALTAGAQPVALASALVHASEILRDPVPGIAILDRRSLLQLRVHRLLHSMPDASSRRGAELMHLLITALVTLMIARALFLGNHADALVRFPIP